MPIRPPHPCNSHACPELTDSRFCPTHQAEADRAFDKARGTSAQRGYNARHRKWRLLVLHRDPICNVCGREPSTVADHKKALSDGGDWSLGNGQGLCARCHGIKTDKEKRERSLFPA